MKVAKRGNLEVQYNDKLIEKVREALNKTPYETVTDEEIFEFIQRSMTSAINKGYAIHE